MPTSATARSMTIEPPCPRVVNCQCCFFAIIPSDRRVWSTPGWSGSNCQLSFARTRYRIPYASPTMTNSSAVVVSSVALTTLSSGKVSVIGCGVHLTIALSLSIFGADFKPCTPSIVSTSFSLSCPKSSNDTCELNRRSGYEVMCRPWTLIAPTH